MDVGYRRFVIRLVSALALVPFVVPTAAAAADRTATLHAGQILRAPDGRAVARDRNVQWRADASAAPARRVAALRRELGPAWIAWDQHAGTPHRILLEGIDVPGAMLDPSIAQAHARALLRRHVALLAPGASADDFVLVTDDLSGGQRSIAFAQHHRGVPVRGGAIQFRYAHDRLVMIGSDALPDVAVTTRSTTVAAALAGTRARDWVRGDVDGGKHVVASTAPIEILPVPRTGGGFDYREVVPVTIEVESPRSRWTVFTDATSGEPVARKQDLVFETAGLVYRVPVRSPQTAPADYGAAFVDLQLDGVDLQTDAVGVYQYQTAGFAGSNAPVGPFVRIVNEAGAVASQQFQASPGSGWVWAAGDDSELDAQLTAFVHLSLVKAYVRGIAPGLAWLDNQLQAHVNVNDQCNAMSDGDSVYFYLASDSCENTGRIADVMYHEFGHSVHQQSLIPGVGFFDTALSEGISDYLAMTIVGESPMARGFFYDDSPLRDADPPGFEFRWPEDRGEVHDEGRIIAGALWDLRKAMIAKYGQSAGVYATDRIWYESTRRAVDIPSMYVEALLVDDDDGNLANGTPNVCEINDAYGPHGLFSIGEAGEQVFAEVGADSLTITVQAALPNFPQCPVSATPTLEWTNVTTGGGGGVQLDGASGAWSTTISNIPANSHLEYQVRMNYDNGAERTLPDNAADPFYQAWVGEVTPLYCTGFTDIAGQWSFLGDWNVGNPAGNAGNRDPVSSFDGDDVIAGTNVNASGLYLPSSFSAALAPKIATLGATNVRLQYWRWLTVEDGFFDRASIKADGTEIWQNHASSEDFLATLHHVDREWRFHDLDLGAAAADGTIDLEFDLAADGGLQFGGWNLDALCVVSVGEPPLISCGDGLLDAGEQCDDANLVDGDGCSSACAIEGGTTDPSGGTTDPSGGGTDTDGDTDGDTDTDGDPSLDGGGLLGRGCGCQLRDDAWAPGWAAFGLLALARRRRRRR